MKLPLYSQTKGRKKITAAKKSDKRAQIKAPPAGRVVVLDENRECHLGTGNVVCATRLRDTTS